MAASIPLQVRHFLNYKAIESQMPEGMRKSYCKILCEFCSFLEKPSQRPTPEPKRTQSHYDHVLDYLELAQAHEPNPHFRADLRQSWLYVYFESQHNPIAFIESSYAVQGYHPEKLWSRLVQNRKAILGPEYSRWYDAADNAMKPERLDIPDYDPTSELTPRVQRQQTSPRRLHRARKLPGLKLRCVES